MGMEIWPSVIGFVFISVLSCAVAVGGETKESTERPVIVLTAFGTSVPEAQAALENIDTSAGRAFPDCEVRWAFTSQFILEKLRKQGQNSLFTRKVPLRNLAEVYSELSAEGKNRVAVQSLHVVPGEEYQELLNTEIPAGMKVSYGLPLLSDQEKIEEFVKVIAPRFGGAEEATILCAHGNDKHPEYNLEIIALDELVRAKYKNVFVATVEGSPGTEKAFAGVKNSGLKKVRFLPIMVVAGDHVMNDVMGEEEESWKSTLKLPATSDDGLGHNDAVVALYIERLREAVKGQ